MPHVFGLSEHAGEPPSALRTHRRRPRTRLGLLLIFIACLGALCLGASLAAPTLARNLADSLPASWIRQSSEDLLKRLDGRHLAPSLASDAEQQMLRAQFSTLTAPASGAPPYRLVFRRSGHPEVLLFTLPSGDIVITDRFFERVQDPGVRLALLCHELGHLQQRHALRNAVEYNLVWLAGAALFGNADSAVRALTHGLAAVRYSPEQIQEATVYARTILRANDMAASLHAQAMRLSPQDTTPAAFGAPTRSAPAASR
ncbi:MAG: hypothetical protein CGU29_03485 [Candidatus Dactylopiibacterium carminicum]|uniref:Peptidase M48 domain-containing protein n=1 Tax=Candidatus Dactylopiibacterium carminicum TaxID=857335 RepID=A0A272EYA2_9RHOO|nr:M48 family metallopeptidase [Candidatus Dactylopiibacterium carminicum]KAF7600010.1 hypothetical protein BGI27_04510 [Candidatus Dactylopiibacterium carminicum]PAS94600.1 MAG: hypothetical protein CGU29_03485 [Candidatus Dactylopiibacterium carminicum]PAT00015.1 MAG: hypothetical protein BSR46_04535 [Candidatus Dactylopiibacterium carminicum]